MALALLRYLGREGENLRFRLDTGSNRFYRFVTGQSIAERWGDNWIQDEVFRSPYIETEAGYMLKSAFETTVPLKWFKGDARYIQLQSFKDKNGRAPAISRPLRINVPVYGTLKTSINMNTNGHNRFNPYMTSSLSYSEVPVSRSLYLDEILKITEVAAPLIKDILPGISGIIEAIGKSGTKAPQVVTGGQTAGSKIDESKIIDILLTVLKKMGENQAPAPLPKTQSISHAESLPFRSAKYYSRAMDGGALSGPALMALLGPVIEKAMPAIQAVLGPLAQQAPEILKVFYDKPLEFLNAINQREMQEKQEDQKFMLNMLQEANKFALAEALSIINGNQTSHPKPDNKFRGAYQANGKNGASIEKSGSYLAFNDQNRIMVNEKERHVFSSGDNNITLKLKLMPTPKTPIPKAKLVVTLMNPLSSKEYLKKEIKLTEQETENLNFVLEPHEVKELPVQEDILVVAELRWPDARSDINSNTKKVKGIHTIYLVGNRFLMSQTSETKEEIELEDRNLYRNFWNRIWESPAGSDSRWEIDARLKYNVFLDVNSPGNIMDTTKTAWENNEDPSELTGKMKAGSKYSLTEINKLANRWEGHTALGDEELSVFKSREIRKMFTMQALSHFSMRGKKDELGEVWVVPVFKLYKFTTGTPETNEQGEVTGYIPSDVWFPRPEYVRIIGLKTK